jgi:hypothetical protein
MKQPLTDESIPLGDCLNAKLTWWRTKDQMAFWRADARPDTWTVRVNDFPEDHLYTLLINDREIGNFDEWPAQWLRVGLRAGDARET